MHVLYQASFLCMFCYRRCPGSQPYKRNDHQFQFEWNEKDIRSYAYTPGLHACLWYKIIESSFDEWRLCEYRSQLAMVNLSL